MLDVFRKPNGPNYTWATDWASQLLALTRGEVLHRVDGSFFNAPATPRESIEAQIYGKSLFGPGTPIYVGTQNFCTLGVAGYDEAGNTIGVTAGHCGAIGDEVYSADSWENGVTGTVVAKSAPTGTGAQGAFGDVAIIKFDDTKAAVTRTYNGVTVAGLGTTPQGLEGLGTNLCKMGVATGLTCGPRMYSTPQLTMAHVCSMQGDSGAPLLAGDRLVGIVSGGVTDLAPCRSPLQGPLFVPVLATTTDSIFAQLDAAEAGTPGRGFRLPDADEPRLR
ncbi:trypsin [Corynebacterium sp. 13CS0277]|nr:trypsin [Corynebacterium sp. 13CS0277]